MRCSGFIALAALTLVAAQAVAVEPTALTREQAELEGLDLGVPAQAQAPPAQAKPAPDRSGTSPKGVSQLNLLLVPDSTADTVMAFDPATGSLINPAFINGAGIFTTPICAILNHDGTQILVSDQVGDVVYAFDLSGTYLGIFAPAGGPNPAVLNNIRGISLRPNGNLLVTNSDATNNDAVAEFDTGGTYLGNFIANGAGGIDSPFDVFYRSDAVMVSGSSSSNVIEYDTSGAPVGVLAPIPTFPEQVTRAANGNYLVANFSPSASEGIYDIQPNGTIVGIYDTATTGGYRGVWELANGNLLVTTGSGVYEITRVVPSTLVDTKITGVSARFIEFTEEQVPVELQSFSAD